MTLPADILDAIGQAVEKAGGDLDDALDLARTWERLTADAAGRVDAMHRENAERRQAYEASAEQ